MHPHHDSERERSQTDQPPRATSHEYADENLVVPKPPEVISFQHPHFVLSFFMRPDQSQRVDSVTVEVLSGDGTSVGTYRTASTIPAIIGSDLARMARQTYRRHEPHILLSCVVSLMKRETPVEWDFDVSSVEPVVHGSVPRFTKVLPTLDEFAHRPSIVDEHLTTVAQRELGAERLTVKISPHLGCMRCVIGNDDLPEQLREWKIKASFDGNLDEESLARDLVHKAGELLVRLHLDGADDLTERLDRGLFNAYKAPPLGSIALRIDSRLEQGCIDIADHTTRLNHSGAQVSLRIGTRFAAIRFLPSPEDPSQETTIVFECSQHYPELSALQIDYWRAPPNLTTFLGESVAHEICSIPDIDVLVPHANKAEELQTMLDGGRTIVAHRLNEELSPAQAHWFRKLACTRFNDGSIRVTLRNQIGGAYHGEIESLSGQSTVELELRMNDPRYENVPPIEDRAGALTIGECAKIAAFIRAVPSNLGAIKSTISYVGHGYARAAFFHPHRGPTLEFLLHDHKVREVVIAALQPESKPNA